MSEVSIITNDEIMEMTQLVFDRYYTELKRQLGRGEVPAEKAEEYCTEILFKVYQALQTRGVAATSYEMDACAIPIINEEIRKILVPLHLNGYRNLRENPRTEPQSETENALKQEQVVESPDTEPKEEFENHDVSEIKSNAVPVVSNGEVQVYPETAESELNPELRMEIRRILQQEFQLEPAQVKPVVVVVNVTAPQAAMPAETPVATETVADEKNEAVKTPQDEVEQNVQAASWESAATAEVPLQEKAEETWDAVEVVELSQETKAVQPATEQEQKAVQPATEQEPLPELDLDIEKLIRESEEAKTAEKKSEGSHLGLWGLIVVLLMVLLWLTAGMLMSYDIVPDINLGYEWFNETVFELF